MKIDKIVFSTSEEYSGFWNLQSKIWKEMLGIEPVCILWGDIKNTDMKDTYGEIIEKKYNHDLVKSFQLTWSKFYHTHTEPETTWIIGDIDLLPLQREWFIDKIKDLPDHVYAHLAYGCLNGGYRFECPSGNHAGLVAYYHLAKGKTFTTALGLDECSFEEQVKRVIYDPERRFGRETTKERLEEYLSNDIKDFRVPENDMNELQYWLADERYSSWRLRRAIGLGLPDNPNMDLNNPNAKEYPTYNSIPYEKGGRVEFISHSTLDTSEEGNSMSLVDRIDRTGFIENQKTGCGPEYRFNMEKLKRNEYVDLHAYRPYNEQEDSLKQIIENCWNESYKKENNNED